MAILRQFIAPLIAVLIFSLALVAVSARIFLPSDMAAPAPIEEDGEIGRVENNENSTLQVFVPLIAPFLEDKSSKV
ncbi:hypothetical protein NIES267_30970 [Calothrix parasitica NIES-267]|uniref:Uncharacterized protein n=1 Tax=Calothrix parasitica NIES-267 TaxID=1973488 RepID=A0A1Z4LR78_9CYAN|nr:hypothetical protein NIES267_30970 [Calothrix parasitica NIES-267]